MKIIFTLLIFITIASCGSHEKNYTNYIWDLEVRYADNSIDTIHYEITGYTWRPWILHLKIVEPGLVSDAGTIPCLVVGSGFYQETIVCYVRSYKVLKYTEIDK